MREDVATGVVGLVALAAIAMLTSTPRAEIVDPTVATSVAIGTGGGWSTDRGGPSRAARVASLPLNPKLRWSRGVGGRVDWPAISDQNGNVIVLIAPSGGGVTESQLIELAGADGAPKSAAKLRTPASSGEVTLEGMLPLVADSAAGPPIVLANGTRVVATIRGYALGIAPGGALLFRTRLGGEIASVPRVGLAPLPNGGFTIARRPELIEVDSHGAIVDRVRVDVGPYLAVRESGEVIGVNTQGDVYSWRAHRVPRVLGAFSITIATADGPCRGGVVIDGVATPGKGERRERALCSNEQVVEQLDLGTSVKKALLGKLPIPYRTGVAVGSRGDVALTIAGGGLLGIGALGNDLGPFDVPGAAPIAVKDGGVGYVPAVGEVAPIIADDGTMAWGSSDGVAIVRAGIVSKITRCGSMFASSTAGLGSAGAGTLLVSCIDGKVELWADK